MPLPLQENFHRIISCLFLSQRGLTRYRKNHPFVPRRDFSRGHEHPPPQLVASPRYIAGILITVAAHSKQRPANINRTGSSLGTNICGEDFIRRAMMSTRNIARKLRRREDVWRSPYFFDRGSTSIHRELPFHPQSRTPGRATAGCACGARSAVLFTGFFAVRL